MPKGGIMSRKSLIVSLFFVFLSGSIHVSAQDALEQADILYNQGGLENYKQCLELCLQATEKNPDSYEANWRSARAYRRYGEEIKRNKLDGWKETCADYGKKGMAFARRAIELDPHRPEGHFFYGLSAGIYSDGVSILTALAEGLKGKTQNGFEKAYEINRMIDDAGPILALGRFWAVLPWPYQNKKKALAYYREYEQTPFFSQKAEGKVYLAELLLKMGGEKNRAEAESLLKTVVHSDEASFAEQAKTILAELNQQE